MPLRASALGYLCLVAAAISLSILAAANDRFAGDLWLARRVQDLPGWFEPVAEAVRFATGTQVVLVLGAVIALVLAVWGRWRLALPFAIGLAALPVLQAGIKNVVDRPRPAADLVERRAGFTSESFPSGHVMSGTLLLFFAMYLALVLPLPRTVRLTTIAAFGAVALLNGVANVYEGVHWPSDVLGGYLWAAVIAAPVVAGGEYLRRCQPAG